MAPDETPETRADPSPGDVVFIKDLLVRGIIGIQDWERKKKQDILVNLSIETDTRPAGATDDFPQALDYRRLAKDVIALCETGRPYLVEKLADDIARTALARQGARRATVRVEKPGALRFARSSGVEITRTPADYS